MDTRELLLRMATVHPVIDKLPTKLNYRWFPSFRMMTATLLCLCFASVHMMNSNMGMAIVCMVNSTEFIDLNFTESHTENRTICLAEGDEFADTLTDRLADDVEEDRAPKLNWSAEEQGYIFSAFNLGLLAMLGTGFLADKFNAKYAIIASVLIASFANFLIAAASSISVYMTIFGRLLVGVSDALLQPSVNSLITRWFPPAERSYALGLATGGRQLGTLLIVPTAGALCGQSFLFGGWPSIFYLSATTGIVFVIIYIAIGADKPSKQNFISDAELKYILSLNSSEEFGKKRIERKIPWMEILKSSPVWAAVIAVICHEFPLMTMIMFLPSYLHDVHHYTATENGILSALPTASLWISKIFSSYLNTFLQRRTKLRRTNICKLLNTIASCGLAIFLFASTTLDASHASLAVVFLCASMASAGLHTPGCQTALVSLAPAFSGAITGLAFFFVASSGIINPLLTKWIVQHGKRIEWNTVFFISTLVALVPVVVFNIWGSADVQPWAKSSRIKSKSTVVSVNLSSAINGNDFIHNNDSQTSSFRSPQLTANI
uniref:Major facilitator superfamily (MFS) profile domain-containing protein n=1 Tax=Parascaris univalens TaxID=6257 RepID=A0A914ZSB1_PARUN